MFYRGRLSLHPSVCITPKPELTSKEEVSKTALEKLLVELKTLERELRESSKEVITTESRLNSLKEIKNGVTIEVARIFVLSDDSDVTVEVAPLVSFDKSDKIETVYSVK